MTDYACVYDVRASRLYIRADRFEECLLRRFRASEGGPSLPAPMRSGHDTCRLMDCSHAKVVIHTCGASFSSALATAACDSAVGVRASISPPRPVPLILAPTAPAPRAATTRSSSSLQLTVSSWHSAWFSSSSLPSAAMSPASSAASPSAASAVYLASRLPNHASSASFLALTSPTTLVVEAVMPVEAYTMRIGPASFFIVKSGAPSVRWKRSTPPYVAAVLSTPDGVPWYPFSPSYPAALTSSSLSVRGSAALSARASDTTCAADAPMPETAVRLPPKVIFAPRFSVSTPRCDSTILTASSPSAAFSTL
mmetsp:Transcript_3254/g.9663  ORF Transcript_3254/g.9663 Transcript_3254/m.9663 type:complete len:310 (+) Transcript_3254:46-975(+)